MSFALVEIGSAHKAFLPLTYTKPVSELRIGILTIREKWSMFLGSFEGHYCEEYLLPKFGSPNSSFDFLINSQVLPSEELIRELKSLKEGEALIKNDVFLGGKCNIDNFTESAKVYSQVDCQILDKIWSLFQLNGGQIKSDYNFLTKNQESEQLEDPYSTVYGKDIFLGKNVKIRSAILNAEDGPIYIDDDAIIGDGSIIQGPFYLGKGSQTSLGSKIRGNTTVGPFSKVGGEISNSIIQGYSNKAHDGYLGNSIIGEWCNLGADTNTSNVKNNYAEIKSWSYLKEDDVKTGLNFCGLIMGDHSKTGINTMFNTASVVGFSSSIFGGGFPPKHVASFGWGGSDDSVQTYNLPKSLETAERVMARRNQKLSKEDIAIFKHIFQISSKYRTWE